MQLTSTEIITKAVKDRNFNNLEELEPKEHSWDWEELDKAAQNLVWDLAALTEGNKVGVLYDPDMDGLLSGYIMESYLKDLGHAPEVVHKMNPHKIHGMYEGTIQWALAEKVEILIVVDAGSGNMAEYVDFLTRAKAENGIDGKVYVFDHHEYEKAEIHGDRVTIINVIDNEEMPKTSGCGVTFRAIEKMQKYTGVQVTRYKKYVGTTILSDVCTMADPDNRYMVDYTFNSILANEPFYNAFMFWGCCNSHISFTIVPLFNALIRLDKLDDVFYLASQFESPSLRRTLMSYRNVKEEQKEVMQEILAKGTLITNIEGITISLRDVATDEERPFNGLIGNNLMGEYGQSALVVALSKDKKTIQGSFRGYDFTNEMLTPYGFTCRGHAQACGVEVTVEDFKNFVKTFKHKVEKAIEYDYEIEKISDLSPKDWIILSQFNELTGKDVPKIKILIKEKPTGIDQKGKKVTYTFENGQSVIGFFQPVDPTAPFIVTPTANRGTFDLIVN